MLEEEVAEERAHARDDVAVALAARVRGLDPQRNLLAQALAGHPGQLAVVALAQPSVEADRDPGAGEGELGGLDGAAQVRRVHDRDPVVAPPLAELACLLAAHGRELPVAPPGRDAVLVVDALRVRLVDDLDAGTASGRAAIVDYVSGTQYED